MKLSDNELHSVMGGSVSAALLNSFVRGISIIIELGQSIGSTIRRISENKTCKLD